MSVVGLDLSLTSTGVADGNGTRRFCPKSRGIERLHDFYTWAAAVRADLVMMEGYSYGSRGKVFDIGEMGGVVKLALSMRGVPFIIVPPSTLKKYATGKGNAGKDEVLSAAIRAGFAGSNNDEADAWWLRHMGLVRVGSIAASAARTRLAEELAVAL
jgi:crossover junction endodeoxyribonuclease RuvC